MIVLTWRKAKGVYTGGRSIEFAECGPFYAKTFVSLMDPYADVTWEIYMNEGFSNDPIARRKSKCLEEAKEAAELYFKTIVSDMNAVL
jgi:hypothetical protein